MRRSGYQWRRSLLQGSWLDCPPLAFVAFQELVCILRPPGAGCVVGKLARWQSRPDIQHRIHDAPAGFNHVRALKQGRIADHAVIEQNLVTGVGIRSKILGIFEAHVNRSHSQYGAWNLGAKAQRNSFHRLDPYYESIRVQLAKRRISEQLEWSALELNRNFRVTLRHTLGRSQIEWHARPPPVVHGQLHCYVGLRPGIGRNSRFATITRHPLAAKYALAVLPAHAAIQHVVGIQGLDRMQNLGLLITDGVRLKRCGGLHGGQAEELHHVVGNHVAQRAGGIEVSAPLFHADGFSIRDLHVVDVTPVPDGFEDGVVEPKHHNILYGLFPQIVIDTVNLIFVQYSFDLAVQSLSGVQIVSERLLDHNAPPPPVLLVRQTGGSQLLGNLG